MKPELLDEVTKLFENTNVQITTQEQRHLGAVIRTPTFAEKYVAGKIEKWMAEISSLSKLALSQQHVAYTAFVHGVVGRSRYVMRTIANTSTLFTPLENAIYQQFILALTGHEQCSQEERKLLSLPARLGGLIITDPTAIAKKEF